MQREIVFGSRIRGTPLSGFLAYDERPFVLLRDGEDGVLSGRNGLSADGDVRADSHGSGLIRAGAPNLTVRNELAKNFAALHARAGVIDGDLLTTGESAIGGGGRAWAAGFVLLSAKAKDGDGKNDDSDSGQFDVSTH